MKRKCILGLTILVLCGIAVSCSSFGTRKVEDIPPVEVLVPINDADPEKFYDTFQEFKWWIGENNIDYPIGGYYDKLNKSAEFKTYGKLTYDRSILGAINKRDDVNGTYRISYEFTASVKDGEIRISGKIDRSLFYKSNGSFADIYVSDDAFQLFIDHINYIASFFEKEG